MKGSNLAAAAAEIGEPPVTAGVKVQLQMESTDTLCLDWDQ